MFPKPLVLIVTVFCLFEVISAYGVFSEMTSRHLKKSHVVKEQLPSIPGLPALPVPSLFPSNATFNASVIQGALQIVASAFTSLVTSVGDLVVKCPTGSILKLFPLLSKVSMELVKLVSVIVTLNVTGTLDAVKDALNKTVETLRDVIAAAGELTDCVATTFVKAIEAVIDNIQKIPPLLGLSL